MAKELLVTPQELIEQRIFIVRGNRIMLDRDLAALYNVETKVLNQAVKRNLSRFPRDFMFQLTQQEADNLKSHVVTSSWGGTRKLPCAFTEHGILMLSSVLNSNKAVAVNIQIMRTFTKLRELMLVHKDLRIKIEEMEQKYDTQFQTVFTAIKRLLDSPPRKKKFPFGFAPHKRKVHKPQSI